MSRLDDLIAHLTKTLSKRTAIAIEGALCLLAAFAASLIGYTSYLLGLSIQLSQLLSTILAVLFSLLLLVLSLFILKNIREKRAKKSSKEFLDFYEALSKREPPDDVMF